MIAFQPDVKTVEDPGEYKQQSWSMDVDQKHSAIPTLKEEGNELYKAGNHIGAADRYAEALGMLEQLLLR